MPAKTPEPMTRRAEAVELWLETDWISTSAMVRELAGGVWKFVPAETKRRLNALQTNRLELRAAYMDTLASNWRELLPDYAEVFDANGL